MKKEVGENKKDPEHLKFKVKKNSCLDTKIGF